MNIVLFLFSFLRFYFLEGLGGFFAPESIEIRQLESGITLIRTESTRFHVILPVNRTALLFYFLFLLFAGGTIIVD